MRARGLTFYKSLKNRLTTSFLSENTSTPENSDARRHIDHQDSVTEQMESNRPICRGIITSNQDVWSIFVENGRITSKAVYGAR